MGACAAAFAATAALSPPSTAALGGNHLCPHHGSSSKRLWKPSSEESPLRKLSGETVLTNGVTIFNSSATDSFAKSPMNS